MSVQNKLYKIGLLDALQGYKAKKFSVAELIQETLNEAKKQKKLNCFISESFELAQKQAKESDILYSEGRYRPLEGATIAIKDLFCTKGTRTTAGSKMLENFIPAYESTVTEKLSHAGSISIGKTNMDEFAMGSANLTSYYGKVINPWKITHSSVDLVPGGSSGGSAACVSAFLSMAALGSDTGGSIRQPAAFTGIVGVKPTYGRCSRFGMVAFSSSLDQAGIFTRSVADAALILEYIMGYDPKDSTSANLEAPKLLSLISSGLQGKKIGIPRDLMEYDGIDEDILKMWQSTISLLEKLGAKIIDINLPNAKYALSTYYVIASAEASSNLSRFDGVRYGHRTEEKCTSLDEMYELTRAEGFGPEVKRRIMIGTNVLSSGFMEAYYLKAQKIRRKIRNDFIKAFEVCEDIILPSAPTEAFGVDEKQDDPVTMYLNDIFTIPASLAGLPAMSIPAAFSKNGLPLGMQIISRDFCEGSMLHTAQNIEQALKLDLTPNGH
ncbi:MAG: Asp-tRNA(Asn)/Glu-tRNA(Gln) amidotransferase subunit GatA [Rickettsiaceae bacterium]|nr:Asp-tRNA(Asn)/Glu-tRNA(Gln) amidotransferase subunit GatA [Rickettsiaceae bacterium]